MATRTAPRLLFTLAFSLIAPLQAASLWEPVNVSQRSATVSSLPFLPDQYSMQRLDETTMRTQLTTAARSRERLQQIVEIPLPNGELIQLNVTEKVIMESDLSAKYPNIKTYAAQAINNPRITGVIGMTELGFHGMLFTEDGKRIFIDRRVTDGEVYYLSYYDTDYHPVDKPVMRCNVEGHDHSLPAFAPQFRTAQRAGDSKRSYRIAIGATGEYTSYHGGTKASAMSAITTTLARVNEMYERDLSVSMTLVADNEKVIFTDAENDPFTNDDPELLIDESQREIDNRIGSANYDIGHVFSTAAGGLAGLSVVCGSQKAEGVTGTQNPQGDAFDIDFVAHEIGHQFGATHTFNAETESCGGTTRSPFTAYEPGSGVTIMAYAGICGPDNDLQNNTDAMFHIKSIEQISTFINDGTAGASCGTATPTGNNQPLANAGDNYTIPANTPFELSGSATDPDTGDTLSYSWEQVDSGTASDVNVDMGDNAIFRPFLPVSTGIRTLPKLSNLLAGTTSKGEILPSSARTITFSLAVRDQNGGVDSDSMQVTVDDSGSAFAITSHNAPTLLTAGETTEVTWNAGSTASPPISCPNVSILLSTDGGNTFPTTLESSTTNDGKQTVTIPAPTSENSTSRIKVACTNNIFFDISDTDISIATATNAAPVASNGTLTVTQNLSNNGSLIFSDANSSDTLTINIVSHGTKGTVNITNEATGAYTYTPNDGALGEDTFTFNVNDGEFDSNTATVTVTINEPSTAPSSASVSVGNTNDTITVTSNVATGTISGLTVLDKTDINALLDTNANPKPVGTEFAYGFIEYQVTGLTPGATITIDVTYPSIPTNPTFYKVDAKNGYVEFTNFTVNGNTVTFTLTDGGEGDADGKADGIITDPIGLDTSIPLTQNLSNSSGGGGANSPFLLLGILLLLSLRRLAKA